MGVPGLLKDGRLAAVPHVSALSLLLSALGVHKTCSETAKAGTHRSSSAHPTHGPCPLRHSWNALFCACVQCDTPRLLIHICGLRGCKVDGLCGCVGRTWVARMLLVGDPGRVREMVGSLNWLHRALWPDGEERS